MLSVTEESLNNFLSDTAFPYTPSSNDMEAIPSGEAPSGDTGGAMPRDTTQSSDSNDSATYQTAQDYIDSLNGNDKWIKYDANTNTAKITSLEAFVKHCKNPSKSVAAFDELNRSQAENGLFGIDANGSAHFDRTLSDFLTTTLTNTQNSVTIHPVMPRNTRMIWQKQTV